METFDFEKEEKTAANTSRSSSLDDRAIKEIQESMCLSLYLQAHELDFEDIDNFSDRMVRRAKTWYTSLSIDSTTTIG